MTSWFVSTTRKVVTSPKPPHHIPQHISRIHLQTLRFCIIRMHTVQRTEPPHHPSFADQKVSKCVRTSRT